MTTPATPLSPVSGARTRSPPRSARWPPATTAFTFVDGHLTVNKAALTVTADDQSREYGDANPRSRAIITGFKNGETLGTSGVTGSPASRRRRRRRARSGSPYAITAAVGTLAAGNYAFTFADGDLTVSKAALLVTPDPQSRTYGQAAPAYTFGVTGFQNSENAATADGYSLPTCSSDYLPTTPVASSPRTISCTAGTADNYTFDVTATALLTVSPATLVVTPDPQSRTYGQAAPAYTFGVTGFQNSENAATADGYSSPTCSSDYTPTTPVASSPRTMTSVTAGTADDYTFDVTATALLTVSPATAGLPPSPGTPCRSIPPPHTATGRCRLVVDGVTALAGLDLSGTTHSAVGSYLDAWTFTDVTGNYLNQTGTVERRDPPCRRQPEGRQDHVRDRRACRRRICVHDQGQEHGSDRFRDVHRH